MRSIATIARNAVVIGALGVAATSVAGPSFVSAAQGGTGTSDGPGPSCCVSVVEGGSAPSNPAGLPGVNLSPSDPGANGGGSRSSIPTIAPPEPTVGNRPVIVRRPQTPDIPETPFIPQTPPPYEPVPVEIPLPEVAPVPINVEQVPVAPAPVALPPAPVVVPEPPAAPAVTEPISRVLFTSSLQPGTQAATVILLFTIIGVWIYGNQIFTQWSAASKARPRGNA